MCGIAGVFKAQGAFDAAGAERRLDEAVKAIAHRGPDARAVRVWPQWGLGLGHVRLSIIYLSQRANQPMGSADGRVWLVFNGEIYNFEEIREELETLGHGFATLSDTEVLIQGYQRWGIEGILSRLVGMFAFALYDREARKLFLARDRAGEKPLYYAEDAGTISFSSEVAGLLKLRPGRPALSASGLESFMVLKFTPSPETLVDGVRKVRPGCFMEFSEAEPQSRVYWMPFYRDQRFHGDPRDRVDAALALAARRCLVSDVPVCAFLSGGIDSSLIVAGAVAAGAKGMTAYTIGYDDLPGYNEFDYARMIAKGFPIDHREVSVSSKDVLSVLQDDALVLDDPITDWVWVPLHFLSRRARADGFKVVLLGEGADELFFGYDAMLKGLADIERWSGPLSRTAARVLVGALGPFYGLTHRGHQRFEKWRRSGLGLPVYWGSSSGFPASLRPHWRGPRAAGRGGTSAEDFIGFLHDVYRQYSPDPDDRANWISFVEFYTKMGEVLLHRVDRVTMRSSLESRAPFLDRDLVELAFSIPGPAKLPDGRLKGLLKDVARRHLPSAVVERKKMGFSFPFKEWLRGPLGPAVEDCFSRSRLFKDGWVDAGFCGTLLSEHRSGYVDHAPRLWMLYSLCRWYDRWLG
ncbi:MAG: asparagine synthase (glutamine-hydrolyzing) [Elusimicrobia bacterium]|nr:asparagine synthase (glutamine-hydrolyzing) [Elusimicrobiota bacterium]